MQSRNMTNAVFLLLAVHYVFNIEYHPKVKDVLCFIQEKMRVLKYTARKSAQYLSFSAALSCMSRPHDTN